MIISLFTNGIPAAEYALLIPRATVGVFYALSGFNKLFTSQGRKNIRESLDKNGIPCVEFFCWWVPFWEFFGGAAYALGFFTAFHAAVLTIISVVALCATGPRKVDSKSNFNLLDRATNWLFLPEVLLANLLLISIFVGEGKFCLDRLIFN